MREVVDAKIVKLIHIETCYDCPYCDTNNVGDWYCRELCNLHDELSTDDCIIPIDIITEVWDKCPLPSAICTDVEEVL